jgi:hypothetical protein
MKLTNFHFQRIDYVVSLKLFADNWILRQDITPTPIQQHIRRGVRIIGSAGVYDDLERNKAFEQTKLGFQSVGRMIVVPVTC